MVVFPVNNLAFPTAPCGVSGTFSKIQLRLWLLLHIVLQSENEMHIRLRTFRKTIFRYKNTPQILSFSKECGAEALTSLF